MILSRFLIISGLLSACAQASMFYVDPSGAGADTNPGSSVKPFATLARAQMAARTCRGREPVTVLLRGGTYFLSETLVFTSADSGTKSAPVIYQAAPGEQPVVSGGVKLELKWLPYKNGIFQAQVPENLRTEEILWEMTHKLRCKYLMTMVTVTASGTKGTVKSTPIISIN